ncbi:MAG: DUF2852 domain-containing protein, partial [Acetobacteraceae bacterium]
SATYPGPNRPPALMVALHVWATAHGIASLFVGPGRWYNSGNPHVERHGCGWRRRVGRAPSGNLAFDDYRAETLRQPEDEQREFVE